MFKDGDDDDDAFEDQQRSLNLREPLPLTRIYQ